MTEFVDWNFITTKADKLLKKGEGKVTLEDCGLKYTIYFCGANVLRIDIAGVADEQSE